jgi:hypothetical protein
MNGSLHEHWQKQNHLITKLLDIQPYDHPTVGVLLTVEKKKKEKN